MKFSIIICGYNEAKHLDNCLESCVNQSYPKNLYEVIYVDNNSTDGSLAIAQKYPIVAVTEEKQGPSEARNKGMEVARGEIFLYVDSDATLDSNYLSVCERALEPEEIGAGMGKVYPSHPTLMSNYLGVSLFERYLRYNQKRYILSAASCNLSLKRSVIQKVGKFSTQSCFLLPSAEDKELSARIRKGGYKIVFEPHMFIHHDNPDTFKRLYKIWIKKSIARVSWIRMGRKDPFSLLFKYNIPLLVVAMTLGLFFINPLISLQIILLIVLLQLGLCLKSAFETGLFFQSFFVKPWMDLFSALVINVAVIYNRIRS